MDKEKRFEQIKKYSKSVSHGNYGIRLKEMDAIRDCSSCIFDMMYWSFCYGFAKGCRKTAKEFKAKQSR